jgi:(R,R)-butanediol dehydrogenase/meso-butanediol dehydrogenase/diacetyl reductase
MLAAVFKRRGVLEIEDRPQPKGLGEEEVLLEVEGSGVCGTDLHILSDPPGHPATEGVILGHEIVARAIAKGSRVQQSDLGTRVVVDPNLKCGVCLACRKGQPNQCENGTTIGISLDGGFTRFVKAPQKALHPIREDVPLKEAVWGELLSCVLGSTERIRIQPGQVGVVIGAGPAGILHAMLFKAAGAKVIIADVASERLSFARSAGITQTVNPQETDLIDYVADVTSAEFADAVVDAVGNQFATCLKVAARTGTVSLFGVNSHAAPAIPQYDITRKELTIVGSFVGRNMFPRSIAVLESRILDLSKLISHDISVSGMPDAIQDAREGKAMKILVRPEEKE